MSDPLFEAAMPFVLRWEGGFVDHPADPRGATNKGVTQAVYDAWRRRQGLPRRSVRRIEAAEVHALYEAGYWQPAKCPLLWQPLDLVQFDTAVNMGTGRAARFLQQAVGATVDGDIGPATERRVAECDRGQAMVNYCNARESFYRGIVARKPSQQVFLKGWLNRLNALRKQVGLPGFESANDEVDLGDAGVMARVPDFGVDPELDAPRPDARKRAASAGRPATAAPVDAAELAAQRLQRAEALASQLAGPLPPPASKPVQLEARALLKPLRDQRAFAAVAALAEPLARLNPGDPTVRLLYAQALTDSGSVVPALAVVSEVAKRLPRDDPSWAEAWGQVGRCHKQIFIDATRGVQRKPPAHARQALVQAMEAYARPYRANPEEHHWHGVNLLALASRAAREGWPLDKPRVDPPALAQRLKRLLLRLRGGDRWVLASLAEVALGEAMLTGQTEGVEDLLADYLFAEGIQAFEVASTLRQFTEVWDLDTLTPRSAGSQLRSAAQVAWAQRLLDMMRARLLQLPGGTLELSPGQLSAAVRRAPADHATRNAGPAGARSARPRSRVGPAPRAAATPGADSTGAEAQPEGRLEALLGATKAKPMTWWMGGLQAARSVALVRRRMGARLGSGFLVRARDMGLTERPDELLLLTNFHVVNREGELPGIRPQQAEVLFEAVDPSRAIAVTGLLWQSAVNEHDAALLRLAEVPAGLEPLALAAELPPRPAPDTSDEDRPRVYVIGHPGGRELSISMADNALIDHEAPPDGQPARPGVWRLHYRAPTEGGSSGSPVFNDLDWGVIALHHMGGRAGMSRLNGAQGTYAANEGLALLALVHAVRAELTA
jgi:lysozyme family protein